MKSLILLVTLAALAVSQASVVKAPISRANLNVGYIRPGDRLLSRQYLYQPPIINAVQYQDVRYRGNRTTRITAIQALEMGFTQNGYAYITSGGIGASNVTVRVQSARGYGFNYQVDIWGR